MNLTKEQQKVKQEVRDLIKSRHWFSMSPFTQTKSQLYDYVVFGLDADYFYKILWPKDRQKLYSLIDMVKQRFAFQTSKRYYILLVVDKNYKIVKEHKEQINIKG